MPITLSGIDSAQVQYGVGSFLMFGDRTGAGSANDLAALNTDFHLARYNFQTAELAGNAPGIELPVVGNTVDEFPTQQGPLDITQGFTLPGYTTKLEPIWRNLLNDERALMVRGTTPPTRGTTESGGRDAAAATDGVADNLALTTTAVTTGFTSPISTVTGFDAEVSNLQYAVSTGSSTDTVTVIGTDYHDSVATETITLNNAIPVNGSVYFKTITSIAASGSVSVDIGTAQLENHRRYVAVFRENAGSRLLYGTDIYFQKGLVPNMYRETWLDTMSMNISRDGAAALTFGCVGKRPITNVDWAGDRSYDGSRTFGGADFVNREGFTGWQAGIVYTPPGGTTVERLAGIDATLTISNNIGFVPTLTGRRTPGSSFRARRNVTLEGRMEYRAEDDQLVNDVLGNEFLEGTYLELVNAATGGFPYKLRFNFGRLQFTNLPDAPVADEGFISRPMTMRALPDGATPAVYIRVETLDPLALSAISL